jgi:hypothetical protein
MFLRLFFICCGSFDPFHYKLVAIDFVVVLHYFLICLLFVVFAYCVFLRI